MTPYITRTPVAGSTFFQCGLTRMSAGTSRQGAPPVAELVAHAQARRWSPRHCLLLLLLVLVLLLLLHSQALGYRVNEVIKTRTRRVGVRQDFFFLCT